MPICGAWFMYWFALQLSQVGYARIKLIFSNLMYNVFFFEKSFFMLTQWCAMHTSEDMRTCGVVVGSTKNSVSECGKEVE